MGLFEGFMGKKVEDKLTKMKAEHDQVAEATDEATKQETPFSEIDTKSTFGIDGEAKNLEEKLQNPEFEPVDDEDKIVVPVNKEPQPENSLEMPEVELDAEPESQPKPEGWDAANIPDAHRGDKAA